MKKYIIGKLEFTQDKISLKNLRSLVTILSQIEYPKDLTVFKLVAALGDKLPEMFSLVLKPVSDEQQELKNLPEFFNENIDDEQVIQIIEDFLALRPTYKKLLNLLPLLK